MEKPSTSTPDRFSEGGILLPEESWNSRDGIEKHDTSEIKKAVDFLYRDAKATIAMEDRAIKHTGIRYPWYDSSLSDLSQWSPHERSSFDGSFREVLGGQTIIQYIKKHYPGRKLNVVEFGGLFRRASQELDKAIGIRETLGVVLVDDRSEDEQWEDTQNSHTVYEANIFALSDNPQYGKKYGIAGLDKVTKWINDNGKADLIISRLGSPVERFNPTGEIFMRVIKMSQGSDPEQAKWLTDHANKDILRMLFLKAFLRWYDYLSDDGTMLVQCPAIGTELLKKICENNPLIELEFHVSESDKILDTIFTTVRLKKLPNSPKHIALGDILKKGE